ncbi:hypothetical protein AZI85_03935 [Bdellovibrio bacteriovorus]|uniref:Uncharacterized protein n=1 Tax=Bdellovibrio bacteriovorus TaxID=959 RepID=A0A150WKN8_BDEBC|nr:hypothetical protein [Bdellovibrio bacteriovorus]KYG64569.1 hypothetical protein AZI85_03935 [Bdellovibrio bacteriovorus]
MLGNIALFLILGLIWVGKSFTSVETTMRGPQSVVPSARAVYSLVSGTDDCPKQIEWIAECQGFTLNSLSTKAPLVQKFCHANQGPQTELEKLERGHKRILSEVTKSENLISKIQTVIFIKDKNSASLSEEDTVIVDETGKFLWEHSQNGRGFSCLFTREQ